MRSKPSLTLEPEFRASVRVLLVSLSLPWALLGTAALGQSPAPRDAAETGYFGGRDLDYWREGKRVKPFMPPSVPPSVPPPALLPVPPQPAGSIIRQRDVLPFEWSRYDDPVNPEFWDDGGDYIAPRPLREAMARPTDENLTRYLEWQSKRLAMVAAFDARLARQGLNPAAGNQPKAPERTATEDATAQAPDVRWRELELLYFYQSACPHCRAEKEHVEDLARRGVRVSFIQLDAGEKAPLHAHSVAYTAAHSKQFAITATPTWIFRRRERSTRLEGEQTDADLVAKLSVLFAGSRKPALAREH